MPTPTDHERNRIRGSMLASANQGRGWVCPPCRRNEHNLGLGHHGQVGALATTCHCPCQELRR